jgi:hypothetical protein
LDLSFVGILIIFANCLYSSFITNGLNNVIFREFPNEQVAGETVIAHRTPEFFGSFAFIARASWEFH